MVIVLKVNSIMEEDPGSQRSVHSQPVVRGAKVSSVKVDEWDGPGQTQGTLVHNYSISESLEDLKETELISTSGEKLGCIG